MLGLKTQSNSSARKAHSSHIPWSCRRKGGARVLGSDREPGLWTVLSSQDGSAVRRFPALAAEGRS